MPSGNRLLLFWKPINADTVTSCITGMRNQLAARPQPGTNFSWDTFHVSIASGGGEVISAFSLFNQMAGMDATIHTHNSGAVDSAALVPFLAGTRRTASKYSGFLLHQMVWTFPTPEQTRAQIAEVTGWLKNYDRMMAELISERSKLSFDDAQRMMKDGTNLTPEQALDYGIIDAIEDFKAPRDTFTWMV